MLLLIHAYPDCYDLWDRVIHILVNANWCIDFFFYFNVNDDYYSLFDQSVENLFIIFFLNLFTYRLSCTLFFLIRNNFVNNSLSFQFIHCLMDQLNSVFFFFKLYDRLSAPFFFCARSRCCFNLNIRDFVIR